LLEADRTSLRVTGSDLDLTTSASVPCLGKAPGRAAVNAKHFQEVVRKMPRGAVSVRIEKNQLEVGYGDGKGWSRFPVQKPDEYPVPPEVKGGIKVSLPGETMVRLVERTSYAVSEETTRASLNGVFLHGTSQQIALVATDGHRLARATCKGSFGELTREGVIVPVRAIATMSRAAAEATSPVELRIAEGRSHAGFTAQVGEFRVQVTARLLEGPYPNYEQVIPKDNPRSLTVTRSDLIEAVDIVASHADANTQQVRFSLKPNQLAVSSATADFGAGEQKVAAQYQGEEMDIGYNARYLLQTLRSIPSEQVVFRLKTALSAGIVEPVGALAQADEELLCLVMPLRLAEAVESEPRPVGASGRK
jgi:DNA polymerase-3 subunit beta